MITELQKRFEADAYKQKMNYAGSAGIAAEQGFLAGVDFLQHLLQQTPCTTPLLAEITRCRSEAEKKKIEWENGMSEHAIEARAMIMLCDHLLGFVQ